MTFLILDAGAFIAVERDDRNILAILKAAREHSLPLRSNGGVVAEVWRGGSGGQASLARLLKAVEVMPLDDALGRAAGVLIRDSGGGSAIDAVVVASARDGDQIVTSDLVDIRVLIDSSGRSIGIVDCQGRLIGATGDPEEMARVFQQHLPESVTHNPDSGETLASLSKEVGSPD